MDKLDHKGRGKNSGHDDRTDYGQVNNENLIGIMDMYVGKRNDMRND